jgi:hypothetical protein
MPFALAPTFWRQLANVSRGSIDINEVDSTTAKVLDIIRGAPKVAAGDPGLFRSIVPRVLRFKTALTDMREVELIPGGRSVEVTLENCEEYRRRLIATRLGEASAQIAALRAGLAEVIPLPLLQLFTWQETERLVCGSKVSSFMYRYILRESCSQFDSLPLTSLTIFLTRLGRGTKEIDIDLLRSVTDYGDSADSGNESGAAVSDVRRAPLRPPTVSRALTRALALRLSAVAPPCSLTLAPSSPRLRTVRARRRSSGVRWKASRRRSARVSSVLCGGGRACRSLRASSKNLSSSDAPRSR